MKNIMYISLTMLATATVMFIVTGTQPLSRQWDRYSTEFFSRINGDRHPSHGPLKHAPGHWYFYAQRMYGNPGINPDMELYLANQRINTLERSGIRKASADNVWQSIGPANMGGRMRAIAFHPSNPNIVYAGAASGGVFKMTDGNDWAPVMDYEASLPVGAIALDPNNPDIVFAGTGEPVYNTALSTSSPSYSGIGIFKSVNGGASWTLLPWPLSSSAIHRILVSPQGNDSLMVAATAGLYKTTNSGTDWTRVLSGVITDLQYKADDNKTVFAVVGTDHGASSNGIYRSRNEGIARSWQKLTANFPSGDSLGRMVLATTPADPNLLLVFLSRKMVGGYPVSNDFFGIMRSTDAGDTWERMQLTGIGEESFGSGQLFYDFCAAISPTNASLVYAGGINIWRSTNGGQSWSRITSQNTVHVDQHVLQFQPGTGALWSGNDGGIYSYNGTTWSSKEPTLETIQYYTVGVDTSATWGIYGGTQDNGTHRLNNAPNRTWSEINTGDGGYVLIDSRNTQKKYIYTTYTVAKYPFRSTDGGVNWLPLNDTALTNNSFSNWITPMLLEPGDPTRLYWGAQRMYLIRNADKVPSYHRLSDTYLVRGGSMNAVITTMAVAKSRPDYMYTGSGDGKIFRTRNLRDTPANVGWEDVSTGIPNKWITRVEVDPRNEHIVYATISGYKTQHVYRTSNGGNEWTSISSNLPDIPVNSIRVHPVYSEVLFIATDAGVYYTTNTGESWERYGLNLPNVVVSDIAFTDTMGTKAKYIVAASYGRGMWYAPLNITVSVPGIEKPGSLSISDAYPNPVAAGTSASIALSMPARGQASVELYNSHGQSVRTLFSGTADAGTMPLRIETYGLTPGIYFIRLQSGATSVTRKLIVMK